MKKVLYITILACSTLWGSCTEKNKQSARTDSFIEKNVAFARAQIGNEIQIIEKSEKFINPVTLKTDSTIVSIRPRACFSPSYNKVKSQTKHVWLLTLL